MQSHNAVAPAAPQHPSVPSLSNEELTEVKNGDSEELKKHYRDLVNGAQSRIMQIMGVDEWPIGQHVELSDDQVELLEDPSRQWGAAEFEWIRISCALAGVLF